MTTLQKYDAIVIGASTAAVSRLCPTLAHRFVTRGYTNPILQ